MPLWRKGGKNKPHVLQRGVFHSLPFRYTAWKHLSTLKLGLTKLASKAVSVLEPLKSWRVPVTAGHFSTPRDLGQGASLQGKDSHKGSAKDHMCLLNKQVTTSFNPNSCFNVFNCILVPGSEFSFLEADTNSLATSKSLPRFCNPLIVPNPSLGQCSL